MLLPIALMLWFVQNQGTEASVLVYPRILEERSSDGRLLLHVHDGLTLSLRKASVAAPEFRVLTEEDGEEVTHIYQGEELDRFLYEDETQLATVHVMETDNGHEIEGVLGPDRRIQPAPGMERSEEGLIAHKIYKIENKRMVDEALLPSSIDLSTVSQRNDNEEERVPGVVTIELFIVSDSSHHKNFNQTKFLVLYACIMVNSVNLRYVAATSPKIKFLLTGIQQDKEESYKHGQGDYVDASITINAFKSYVQTKKASFGNPDVVFLMTSYNLYSTSGGTADPNSLGIGYVGGICTEFQVALGEDHAGYYDGMHTMTHETAHVLGSEHDESAPAASIKGHPGSLSCKWSTGNIMSYENKGPEHHQFSRCSIDQMRYVISLRGRVCWDVTRPGRTREGQYPGMMVSLKAFCKLLFPDRNDVVPDTDSQYLGKCKVKCKYAVIRTENFGSYIRTLTTWYSKTKDALDYMPCGDKQVCIQGLCVPRPSRPPKKPKSTKSPKPTKQKV